jgi:FSR family fosmidomycin resistance protein-like MFS transporter
MSVASVPIAAQATARQDAQTIGLIGLAHGTSHFFHLLLPPLFPLLLQEFGYSYAQLGALVSVFFVVSGVGQALAGFVVDRIGARPVLWAAMVCFALAAVLGASAQGYSALVAASALAGLGNAPFHPADFTVLNRRVSSQRLGHAFSVHGITGNLGWAAAPAVLLSVAHATGSWRVAMASAAVLAVVVLAVLVWQREAIDDRRGAPWVQPAPGPAGAAPHGAPVPTEPPAHPLAFLRLPSVWLSFSFFFWTTCALSGIQSFAGPALGMLFGLPLAQTQWVVTGYMLCGAAGMVAGGFLAAQQERLDRLIAMCLIASAAALLLVATGYLPGGVALAVVVLVGVGTGMAGPSRDMLIKRAAPPGATGRVYGTVYSGLDLGFAMAAPIFGYWLDHGLAAAVFVGCAASLVLGVLSATAVGHSLASRLAVTAK